MTTGTGTLCHRMFFSQIESPRCTTAFLLSIGIHAGSVGLNEFYWKSLLYQVFLSLALGLIMSTIITTICSSCIHSAIVQASTQIWCNPWILEVRFTS
jgi:hypothetical protein